MAGRPGLSFAEALLDILTYCLYPKELQVCRFASRPVVVTAAEPFRQLQLSDLENIFSSAPVLTEHTSRCQLRDQYQLVHSHPFLSIYIEQCKFGVLQVIAADQPYTYQNLASRLANSYYYLWKHFLVPYSTNHRKLRKPR